MPRLKRRREIAGGLEPELGWDTVEAVGDISRGAAWRWIAKGTRYSLDDPIVQENPALFRFPAQKLVRRREA